jgi:hypothetical protein
MAGCSEKVIIDDSTGCCQLSFEWMKDEKKQKRLCLYSPLINF